MSLFKNACSCFVYILVFSRKLNIFCVVSATMAWVVGMADDENPDAGAARGKKRKKQKASKSKLFDE